jgi:hypothetical protein
LGDLLSWLGRAAGGRLAYRDFEKNYLDWAVTELRELKLAGVIANDDAKKPQLEQVFVSLEVDGQRETGSTADIAEILRQRICEHSSRPADAAEVLQFCAERLADLTPVEKSAIRFLVAHSHLRYPRIRLLLDRLRCSIARRGYPPWRNYALYLCGKLVKHARSVSGDPGALQLRWLLGNHPRFAVLGAPGAGKSTLLQFIGLTYAKHKAGDPKLRQRGLHRRRFGPGKWRLPIFIPLASVAARLSAAHRDGRDPSLIDVLPGILPPDLQNDPVAGRYFVHQLTRGNCILLLDGLDEVSSDTEFQRAVRAIQSLALKYRENQFVASSRIAGWRSGLSADFPVFYVRELNDTQVTSFIDTWYSAVELNAVVGRVQDEGPAEQRARQRRAAQRAAELKQALRENVGIRRLATNPMLLSIIALVHRSLATLPRERSKLYSQCAQILLEQWDISRGIRVDDTELKLEQKQAVMRRLAFAFHTGQLGEQSVREATRENVIGVMLGILPSLGKPPEDAARLLQHLIARSGIISERRPNVLAFAHLTFQEYFSAQYLAFDATGAQREALLSRERLLAEWWREVILLHAGLLPDSGDFIARVYDCDPGDFLQQTTRLAGLCLGEAVLVQNPDVRELILRKLLEVRTRGDKALAGAAPLSKAVEDYLITWSRGPRWNEHAMAASIAELGRKGSLDSAQQTFATMLSSAVPATARAALEILPALPPQMLSAEVWDRVVAAMESGDETLRAAAARALVKTSGLRLPEQQCQTVAGCAKEERSADVAMLAGRALLNVAGDQPFGAPIVLDVYRRRLRAAPHVRYDWRWHSFLLDSVDFIGKGADSTQLKAMLSLARRAGETGTVLSRLLELRSDPVLIEAAVDLCRAQHRTERAWGAVALGAVGPELAIRHNVVAALEPLLGDPSPPVSQSAGRSIARLAEKGLLPQVVTALRSLVGSRSPRARQGAIAAAGLLQPEAFLDTFAQTAVSMLSDGESRVRYAAAGALATLRGAAPSAAAVDGLLRCAKDEDSRVRSRALLTLAELSAQGPSERLLQLLSGALDDSAHLVRLAATISMGRAANNVRPTEEMLGRLVRLLGRDLWLLDRLPMRSVLGPWLFEMSDVQLPAVYLPVGPRLLPASGFDVDYDVALPPFAARRLQSVLAIVWTLGELGKHAFTGKVIEALSGPLDTRLDFVRFHTLEALGKIGSATASDKAFDLLVTAYRKEPSLALAAYRRTRQLDHDVSAAHEGPAYGQALENHPLVVTGRRLAPDLVADRLRPCLSDSDPQVRLLALLSAEMVLRGSALRTLDDAVARMLQEDPAEVREAAWEMFCRRAAPPPA